LAFDKPSGQDMKHLSPIHIYHYEKLLVLSNTKD